MMTSYDLHALLKEVLPKAGFVKQGRAWTRNTNVLLWVIQLDRSPYGEHFSLDIGATLIQSLTNTGPVTVSDCPILLHLENLPLTIPPEIGNPRFDDFRSAAIMSFDLTNDMDDEERTQLLRSIIQTLGVYLRGITNKQDLRERYQLGDFKSAVIRKDLRQQFLAPDPNNSPGEPM